MEKIIPLFNELQEILSKSNLQHSLQFPQLVVVGAQSTGKSSVLEAIIGKDFLPRGTGIVTRRPIILQLNNTPKGSEEYAEFSHLKGERVRDWNLVRKEIEEETQKIAGQNKGISSMPIIVRIFSPNVVDLNIVDLPGITKIPVGDQPPDIEERIREIVLTYVKNPNTIILAVTAANTDIANSDSLKLAREIDPEGNRTIGIVTKLDLMDEGTDCLDVLQGKIYKLRLGYIGVVCRGQKDLENHKAIQDALKDERAFFENHKAYKNIADRMGTPHLTKTLNATFVQHIKKTLPAIRQNILDLIQAKEFEMSQYGDSGIDLSDKQAKGFLILSLISKFANAYSEMIKGRYVKTTTTELFGGARINYIFSDVFKKCITEINPFDVLSDDDIRTAIRNANGLRPSLFIPEMAFEILIKQQISRIQEPALECSHLVYEELRKILFHINIPDISRFEVLNSKIYEVMERVLSRCLSPTDQMIKNLVEIELGYINTNHPDFVGGTNTLMGMVHNPPEQPHHLRVQEIDIDDRKSERPEKSIREKVNHQPKSAGLNKSDQEKGGLFSFLGFGGGKKVQVDDLDNRLENLNLSSKLNQDGQQDLSMSTTSIFKNNFGAMARDNPFYIERNINNQYERTYLPQPPNHVKVPENISKREQIEVDMIKKLITSYFNVVKKNVNDSVPKTVINFLVNGSKNICERELVQTLYQEKLYDELLEENSFIVKSRDECRKTLSLLNNCANILMEIDSKL